MKKELYLTLILLPALLASCRDDNTPAPEIEQKTFSGYANLEIYYAGQLDPGHTAVITPTGENRALLTLYSTFDLTQLGIQGLDQTIPVAGVFPGSPKTEIPLTLTAGDGCRSFSGTLETEYVTTSYSGNFTTDKLTLELPDVKLKDTSLSGTVLTPSPLVKKKEGIGYDSTPFHIIWEIDPLPDVNIDLQGILQTLVTIPCIPVYHNTAYSSISQLIVQSLQTVALLDNGNIVVRYYGNGGGGSTLLLTTQGNTLQYLPVAPGYIKLYPNVEALAALLLNSNPGGFTLPDIPEELKPIGLALMKDLVPILSEGIPMQYTLTSDGMDIYFNTETGARFTADFLKALVSDPQILGKVKELLAADPGLSQYLPQIEKLIESLPTVLEKTTKLEVGLSFKKG